MPIWSLTKERIEKLLKQVGDKELEIDTLIKLTKEDLWTRDLDQFIEEWRFQLNDEKKRQKKVDNMGRRASTKLKIGGGPAGRKRKAESDDSDFDSAPKVKKPAAPKQPKQPGGMLGSYFNQNAPEATKAKKTSPKAKPRALTGMAKALQESVKPPAKKEAKSEDVWLTLDGGSDVPKVTKAKASAPAKKAPAQKKIKESDDDDEIMEDDSELEHITRPTTSRNQRAAATKPVKYNIADSDSDGDDMLSGIGNMVKGINTTSGAVDSSRLMFSSTKARPGSSAGLSKKPTTSRVTEIVEEDDANYSMLAPPTVAEGAVPTAKKTVISDDDDSFDSMDDIAPAPAPKASKPKPAPKATSKPTAKSTASAAAKKPTKAAVKPAEPKKLPLSPAAKAYAAKKAKQEKLAMAADDSEDELEKVANEIMDDDDDDDDDGEVATRRPARRAAATAPKKKWVISDDEDEETTGVFEDEDSFD